MRLLRAEKVKTRRVLVSMHHGIMMAEFEAASREVLEEWLRQECFHFDCIRHTDFESNEGAADARRLAAQGG